MLFLPRIIKIWAFDSAFSKIANAALDLNFMSDSRGGFYSHESNLIHLRKKFSIETAHRSPDRLHRRKQAILLQCRREGLSLTATVSNFGTIHGHLIVKIRMVHCNKSELLSKSRSATRDHQEGVSLSL